MRRGFFDSVFVVFFSAALTLFYSTFRRSSADSASDATPGGRPSANVGGQNRVSVCPCARDEVGLILIFIDSFLINSLIFSEIFFFSLLFETLLWAENIELKIFCVKFCYILALNLLLYFLVPYKFAVHAKDSNLKLLHFFIFK